MAKKKQKILRKKRAKKTCKKDKEKKPVLEISQTRCDVKAFIERFSSDVAKKRKAYLSYAQKLQKKKKQ